MKRFWAKVEKGDGCWLWTGTRSGRYGSFYFEGRQIGAHRAAWIITRGGIPDGMFVLHRCDTPLCCRPDHLFLGAPADNTADMIAKGRHWTPSGEASPHTQLTDAQVAEIREAWPTETQTAIAARFGVSQPLVSLIVRGKHR